MPKGFFSQAACLLTDGRTTLDNIRGALRQHRLEVAKETPASATWQFGGPSFIVPFRPAVNGYAAVDLVGHTWPDSMGDPRNDVDTFGAWSMGYFGPFAFPGNLQRAQQHAWAWEPGRTVPNTHHGFIRIRIGYVFGGNPDAPVLPKDYDALAELAFLNEIVLALLKTNGVLCYFNPNGEVLCDHATFHEVWDGCRVENKIPFQLWSNVRFFNLTDKLGFMDTVGNAQLDIPDIEVLFPKAAYDPGTIDYYMRNVTHYLREIHPRAIASGESIDGPDETNLSWTAEVIEDPIVTPPRRALRLYPKAESKRISRSLAAIKAAGEAGA